MTELETPLPCNHSAASGCARQAIYSVYDLSAHNGTTAHLEFVAAGDDETRRLAALRAMTKATEKFDAPPEDQPLFDVGD